MAFLAKRKIKRAAITQEPVSAPEIAGEPEPDLGPEPKWMPEARAAADEITGKEFTNGFTNGAVKPEPAKAVEPPAQVLDGGGKRDSERAAAPKESVPAVDLHKATKKAREQDELPPHSVEAEQGVIGCLMLDPTAVPHAIERLRVGADSFYDLRHRTIYEAIVEMDAKNEAIDTITLQQRLKQLNALDSIGGNGFLSQLPDCVPSAANIGYYITILNDQSLRRDMQAHAVDVVKASKSTNKAEEELPELETRLLKLSRNPSSKKTRSLKDVVIEVHQKIERFQENKGKISGIGTGFTDLDKMTNGVNPQDYWIIAGMTSSGKSSLAMNIAEHIAVDLRWPCSYFTLEMSAASIVLRMKCSHARVDSNKVKRGLMDNEEGERMAAAGKRLLGAPLYFHDESGLTLPKFRSVIRRHVSEYGIKAAVIDYLQLFSNSTKHGENREREVAQISNCVKQAARDFNIGVIALSQFNRDFEKSPNRRPRLADIRESGVITQDSDMVGLLYRPKQEGEDDLIQPVNLYIAKQRDGAVGDVRLVQFKQFTRFESASKIAQEDLPQI